MSPRKKAASATAAKKPDAPIEVRIGIQHTVQPVAFQSDSHPDELSEEISTAWASNELVTLTDVHGARVLVPTEKIAYVEIGPPAKPRVGFGG